MGLSVASSHVNPPPPLPFKPATSSPPQSPVASVPSPRRGIRRSESAIFTTLKLSSPTHQPLRRSLSANCYCFGDETTPPPSSTPSSSSSSLSPSSASSHHRNDEEFLTYPTTEPEEPTLTLTLFDGDGDSNHDHNHTFIPSPAPRTQTPSPPSHHRPTKLNLHDLGIRPDPPAWPARDELIRHLQLTRRANSFDIPLSVRMIMKKRKQQQREVRGAGTGGGVAKAFNATVSVIREMQCQALWLRGLALDENFETISGRCGVEMNSTFVWLFREVFSRTPDLMVDVMMLTVDFASVEIQKQSQVEEEEDVAAVVAETDEEEKARDVVVEEEEEEEEEELGGINEEMGMIEVESPRASSSVRQQRKENRMYRNLVLTEVYFRTDLSYQMGISNEPDNALLFANYAQFLSLVSRDYDRAEECFKRAIQLDPSDPEPMSGYAKFLWEVRDDLWGAEDMFQRAAAAADPEDSYHVSNYAHFLWRTGADDTCFPLEA